MILETPQSYALEKKSVDLLLLKAEVMSIKRLLKVNVCNLAETCALDFKWLLFDPGSLRGKDTV
jgi:hypothetical protein